MNYLEIFGTFIGIIYLWLEYRASIYLWLAGIIMPAIYIFVYYDAGLYADFGINIYYLIAAIYGWFFWMWGHGEKKSLPITHTPWKCYLPLFLVFIVSFVGIARILIEYTDSNVPWLDSFTTALSIVGMSNGLPGFLSTSSVADFISIKISISPPHCTDFTPL